MAAECVSLLAFDRNGTVNRRQATAKSVMLIYLQGGAPTQDMFDMKPNAPVEVRRRIQAGRVFRSGYRRLRTSAQDGKMDA